MTDLATLPALLQSGPAAADAIGAPERRTMTRGELTALVNRIGGGLRDIGIGQQDAVAIVAPNGPEMAALFVAVASFAVAAPLNAAYRGDEFDFYLGDLNAKALLILGGPDSPAREVAARRSIRIIDVTPDLDGPAGALTLSIPFADHGAPTAKPDDVALVLHTSGTTSRPKIVPLTHRNLATSARNIVHTLSLTPADRSLVVMPLFHIHGLIAALLSSFAAGASDFGGSGAGASSASGNCGPLRVSRNAAMPTMTTSSSTISQGSIRKRASSCCDARAPFRGAAP